MTEKAPIRTLRGRAARLSRLLPATGPPTAARTPFVLLVVVLLGGGLILLLLLNTSLSQGSFRLSKLKKETTELTEEEQTLQQEVDGYSAPETLERRARELGMVPGGSPAFLEPDGTVRGTPSAAPAAPAPVPGASAPGTPDAPAASSVSPAERASAGRPEGRFARPFAAPSTLMWSGSAFRAAIAPTATTGR
jgi:hypothetical protein